jgi:pyruvate dehydrogenase E2 component (dihydrolipoamide acetyltransferase)
MSEVTLPRLSDSMETGTVLKWLKEDGDAVTAGEDLVEIETDKATLTHAAEAAGVLTILVREGETVAVGAPIARLGTTTASGEIPPPPATSAAVVVAPAARTGLRVSPLARRVAQVHGVVLEQVPGTGPRGRITRSDVLAAAGIVPEPPVVAAEAPAPPTTNGSGPLQPLSRLQQVVARRMSEVNLTVPDFQVQTEVQIGEAIAFRAQLKAHTEDGAPPSLNDLIVKAAGLALRDHPLANGSYQESGFEMHEQVNVGVAVAAEGALVVPTVFDADRKSLGQVARDTRRLAERVRAGTVTPAELSGGTFTVSNLGMFGMTAITPVVNAPQAAILGVGAAREVLRRVDGEIVDDALLTLTLSCDHRILYGADAARFLARIRDLLEAPLRLTL